MLRLYIVEYDETVKEESIGDTGQRFKTEAECRRHMKSCPADYDGTYELHPDGEKRNRIRRFHVEPQTTLDFKDVK